MNFEKLLDTVPILAGLGIYSVIQGIHKNIMAPFLRVIQCNKYYLQLCRFPNMFAKQINCEPVLSTIKCETFTISMPKMMDGKQYWDMEKHRQLSNQNRNSLRMKEHKHQSFTTKIFNSINISILTNVNFWKQ